MKVLTTVEAQLQKLKSPQVRDLGWACFSQALCVIERNAGNKPLTAGPKTAGSAAHTSLFEPTQDRLAWLNTLDNQADALHKHLAARHGRRRLGIYFEHLIEFFILNDPQLELAARNVPVRNADRTLGEFDLLYYNRASDTPSALIHLEVAVKFYLGLPDALRQARRFSWRGPGSQDAFEIKLDKMITQQSRLGESADAIEPLKALGLGLPSVQRIGVAGELFQPLFQPPFQQLGAAIAVPEECAARHHSAHWCYLSDIEKLGASDNTRALLLDKSHWLTPLPEHYLQANGVPFSSIRLKLNEHFETTDFPVMIELLGSDFSTGTRANNHTANSQTMAEATAERVFVVPASWPAKGMGG